MSENIPNPLQEKISRRLRFYEDLGIGEFYRDRRSSNSQTSAPVSSSSAAATDMSPQLKIPSATASTSLFTPEKSPSAPATKPLFLPTSPSAPSLFDSSHRVVSETLLQVRQDLGECTRCKLHTTRNKIVFGDGSAHAELVFIGEGPGADEDAQGLPFVGRAGKLLTQMIEAMGLKREQVYICNVVKCRPPGNRQPEKDEVDQCSPFLLRQLDVLRPKVIVCLGATAAQTLLQTNRGISHFRGEWLDYRGYKMIATYHPAYLLRNPAAKADVWKDLQKVMAVLGLEVKKPKAR